MEHSAPLSLPIPNNSNDNNNSSNIVTSMTTSSLWDPSGDPEFSLEEFLQAQNEQFVRSLAPTLAYMAVVMLFGLAGNSLVLAVYYRRFPPSLPRTYILALGVTDLMTNALSMPADVVEVALHNTFFNGGLCKTFRTVKCFLGFLSALILVAVALDRRRAICRPQSPAWNVRHVLVVVSVVSVIFTAPYSVLTGPRTVPYPGVVANVSGLECSVQDLYVKSLFLFVYNMSSGLMLLLCISIMLGSYGAVARKLWLHRKTTGILRGADSDSRKGSLPASTSASTHTYTFEASSSSRSGPNPSHTSAPGPSQDPPKAETSHPGNVQNVDGGLSAVTTPLVADTSFTVSANVQEVPASSDCEESVVGLAMATPEPSEATHLENKEHTGFQTNAAIPDTTQQSCRAATTTTTTRSGCEAVEERRGQSFLSRFRDWFSHIRPLQGPPTHSQTRKTSSGSRCTGGQGRGQRSMRLEGSSGRKRKSKESRRGSVKKVPTRTTLMLLVVTVVFVVNYFPYLLLVSLRSRLGPEAMVEALGLNGCHVMLRSYFLNSAVNSLVYSLCSARFRLQCRGLLLSSTCGNT